MKIRFPVQELEHLFRVQRTGMQNTPLHDWHVAHNASMTDFHGWHMPLFYTGITEEHNFTREHAGLFDLGHMGRVFVRGSDARKFVDYLTPANVASAQTGDVQYSFLLREDGTAIDDITIYYHDEFVLLIINAGNRERDVQWIKEKAGAWPDVTIDDRCESWSMLAIQGPSSESITSKVLGEDPSALAYYKFLYYKESRFGEMVISRTGYTGEDGFEIYLSKEQASLLWEKLIAAGDDRIRPIGLGARDSLRLEAGMPLYGHELNDSLTPVHAGFNRYISLDKGDFLGKKSLESLVSSGTDKKLAGFEMPQRGPIPREGFNIFSPEGQVIGQITSGIFSPTLQKNVGMAYVEPAYAKPGTEIQIEIRNKRYPATIVKRPFYRRKRP